MEAVALLEKNGVISNNVASGLIAKYKKLLEEHLVYIKEHGEDPEYIANWKWKRTS
jgi:phosphoketolase